MNEDIKANNKQTHKIMRLLWTIVQEQTGQPEKKKKRIKSWKHANFQDWIRRKSKQKLNRLVISNKIELVIKKTAK